MTSQFVYPPPPPTTNLIPSKHRLRLMRSTRKLGAVLGAVAQLSETDPKFLPELLPVTAQNSPRPSTSSFSSSCSSIKSSRRQGSIFTSPPMTPELICSSASPMSSTSSLALSDTTSLSKDISAKPLSKSLSQRKKCSNELPRPLVLRLNAVPTRYQTAPSTPQSCSLVPPTPSTADTLVPPSPLTPTPTTPVSPTPSETRRKRMAKLTRTLGERIPPHLVTFAIRKRSSHSLKSTFDPCETSSATPNRAGRRRSMSVDFVAGGVSNPSPCGQSSRVWVTEHPSWTGEWNRRDIRDVQKQLRNLKAS
ncbi:hypothetical protein QCA50_007422 [Cerrena zonata]|uniref:Uncharacterized protein n=1 Tax=Cerrena zonata TaxID=2478898 RepID=A0AAW0GE23_9APHY